MMVFDIDNVFMNRSHSDTAAEAFDFRLIAETNTLLETELLDRLASVPNRHKRVRKAQAGCASSSVWSPWAAHKSRDATTAC